MKKALVFGAALTFSSLCFAITDTESGVIACVNKTTNLDNDSAKKTEVVNAIFKQLRLSARFNQATHGGSANRYSISNTADYAKGYEACEQHIAKTDPDGRRYGKKRVLDIPIAF